MRTSIAIALVVSIPVASAVACLWDTETLLQERAVVPTTLETIVGKFLRHSPSYYQWRIDDRLQKLTDDPENELLLDDLAVAYEKLGRHDDAIEVAKRQLVRNPRRYETVANLGTFLIHSGKFEEGLEYIETAIEINPDAHFGREKYQAILVKYVLSHSRNGEYELPLGRKRLAAKDWEERYPFNQFAAIELSDGQLTSLSEKQRRSAIDGILGMMRFSRHDHPVLLEALGELLEIEEHKRLAFRCYISAAELATTKSANQDYQTYARNVISEQYAWGDYDNPVPVEPVRERFKQEQADADAWFAELTQREAEWIAAGEDVDAKFSEQYRLPPESIEFDEPEQARYSYDNNFGDAWFKQLSLMFLVCLGAVAIVGVVTVSVVKIYRSGESASVRR